MIASHNLSLDKRNTSELHMAIQDKNVDAERNEVETLKIKERGRLEGGKVTIKHWNGTKLRVGRGNGGLELHDEEAEQENTEYLERTHRLSVKQAKRNIVQAEMERLMAATLWKP